MNSIYEKHIHVFKTSENWFAKRVSIIRIEHQNAAIRTAFFALAENEEIMFLDRDLIIRFTKRASHSKVNRKLKLEICMGYCC